LENYVSAIWSAVGMTVEIAAGVARGSFEGAEVAGVRKWKGVAAYFGVVLAVDANDCRIRRYCQWLRRFQRASGVQRI
jgi:hypothetical protein